MSSAVAIMMANSDFLEKDPLSKMCCFMHYSLGKDTLFVNDYQLLKTVI